MAKYFDIKKCGHKAQVCQYQDGEGAKQRHRRRLKTTNTYLATFKKWCEDNGVSFRRLNNGEQWQMRKNGQCFN